MDHELDRKSLIIYLNDLRILETIKYQTKISCEKQMMFITVLQRKR